MITEMDTAIGTILAELKTTGKLENTLIIFVSDNGGSNEGHLKNTIERMEKLWTSSVVPEKTPDGEPVHPGDWPGVELGGPESYGSYGPRWANVSNTPFRRHKSWTHEGGIATPCIMHWPVRFGPKTETRAIAHFIDLFTTIGAAANVEQSQLEGFNLLPLLNNQVDAEIIEMFSTREIGWEHEGNRAYGTGKWKIVSKYPGTWKTMYPYKNEGRWELYDMENDRSELNDLAKSNPEKLKALIQSYESWSSRIGVIPWEKLSGKRE